MHLQLVSGVGITTLGWLMVTFVTQPETDDVLRSFYKKISPGGPGWKKVLLKAEQDGDAIGDGNWQLPLEILAMVLGCFMVYSSLFGVGYWLYGNTSIALILSLITLVTGYWLFRIWVKLQVK